MKNETICKKLKTILSDKLYVLAIFNNGSSIVGTDLPQSDVDFTIVVKSKSDINKTLSLLKKNLKFLGVYHEVPHFEFKKKLGICIYDKQTMDFFVNILYKSKKDFLQWQKVLQHKIIEAIPVYDPKDLLKRYQAKINSYPKRIQNAVFTDAMRELQEIYKEWKDYGFRNEFNFIFQLPEIMKQICLALYSKNKRLFMLPYKRLHKDLKELQPNIEKEMYYLIQGTHSKKNLEEKRRTLKKIIDKLQK